MCGIIATAHINCNCVKMAQCLQSLKHRGPDDYGHWNSSARSVWLGHRRLAIVDTSEAGRQPMHNEDKTIWSICNGEIYNYPTLRIYLEKLGHQFYSNSDSEVLLHAYEAWGEKFVEHLEGMFAFALWDEKNQRLLAARDRVGIKPLYYAKVGEGVILASEIRPLLSLLNFKPDPDPTALAYMMTLGYIPSPLSIWQGIEKLEPGHLLIWQADKSLQKKCYWEPPRYIDTSEVNSSPEEWQEIFNTVLKEHLLSDVPVSLFLSGGLDSSSIALGLRELGQSVEAITVSFPDSPQNEAPIAIETAKHLGHSYRQVPIQIESVNKLLHQVAESFDEPQGYSALISMYSISRAAAQDFKVVLAGDGGDEIFGGYSWYRNLSGVFPVHSPWIRHLLSPFVRYGDSSKLSHKAMRHFAQISPLHHHAWRLYPRFLPEEAQALLAPMGLRFGDRQMLAPLYKHFEPTLPLKRALQRIDLMTFCTDSILAKVDRASMAHSLEVRVPFLDRRLIEWAMTQPLQSREETESKPILRDYLKSRVPKKVLKHPKQGFSLRVLSRFDWNAAIEITRKGAWVKQGYWSPNWENLLHEKMPNRTARIWNLMMLSYWAKVWL